MNTTKLESRPYRAIYRANARRKCEWGKLDNWRQQVEAARLERRERWAQYAKVVALVGMAVGIAMLEAVLKW